MKQENKNPCIVSMEIAFSYDIIIYMYNLVKSMKNYSNSTSGTRALVSLQTYSSLKHLKIQEMVLMAYRKWGWKCVQENLLKFSEEAKTHNA